MNKIILTLHKVCKSIGKIALRLDKSWDRWERDEKEYREECAERKIAYVNPFYNLWPF